MLEIYRIPTELGDFYVRRPFNQSTYQECTPSGTLVMSTSLTFLGLTLEQVLARGGVLASA